MIDYIPDKLYKPRTNGLWSAWATVAPVISDIMSRFNVRTGKAIELGVGNGYSYSVLQNYFTTVIGVDINMKDFRGIIMFYLKPILRSLLKQIKTIMTLFILTCPILTNRL